MIAVKFFRLPKPNTNDRSWGVFMNGERPPTGSWLDCLVVIEKELDSIRWVKEDITSFAIDGINLFYHDIRNRLDRIAYCAGRAMEDLDRLKKPKNGVF
jgi:hypothetical protein